MVSDPLGNIEVLLLDVDGVLTEGTVTYNDDGIEYKQFNVRDGLGIRMLMHFGIPVGIVTGRCSKALVHRCNNLGIELLFDGIQNKADVLEAIVSRTGSSPDTMAFMGDDLVDLPLMRKIGVPIAVSDAHPVVCAAATLITTARGGNGAVREICEAILKAKALWNQVLRSFE